MEKFSNMSQEKHIKRIRLRMLSSMLMLLVFSCQQNPNANENPTKREVKTFDLDGVVYKQSKTNGVLDGIQERLDTNGNKIVVIYKMGQESGTRKIFKNDVLTKEIEFKNGHLNGAFKMYYPSGRLRIDAMVCGGIVYYLKEFDSIGNTKGEFISTYVGLNCYHDTLSYDIKIGGNVENKSVVFVSVLFNINGKDTVKCKDIVYNEISRNDTVITYKLPKTGKYFVKIIVQNTLTEYEDSFWHIITTEPKFNILESDSSIPAIVNDSLGIPSLINMPSLQKVTN